MTGRASVLLRRGDIVVVADRSGGDFGGKPRPAVVVQDDRFADLEHCAVCLITTQPTGAPLFRIPIEPGERSGLRKPSRIMVEKLMSLRATRVTGPIGRLSREEDAALNRALALFLGFA